MFEGLSLSLDDSAVETMLNSPKGLVGLHMRKIGLQILSGARRMTGVRTGALKRSLKMRQGVRGRYQFVVVGAYVPHAEMHHEGTSRHTITTHTGRLMRFNVGGKVVYARKVNHPGTKPRKYLTVPMERAVK